MLKQFVVIAIVLSGTLVASVPATLAAELWEGAWTENPKLYPCDAPRGDGPPLVRMSKDVTPGIYRQASPGGETQSPAGNYGQITFEQEADPWVCYMTKVTTVRDMEAWIFDLECGGEGEIWRQRSIIMQIKNEGSGPTVAAYNLFWA